MQLGDFHLGAPLTTLPPEKADAFRDAMREVVIGAFERARREGVELVLMPGDLFEQNGVDPAGQLRFIYEQAAAIAPVPVVITPGNHDPVHPESPYEKVEKPANVLLFKSRMFRRQELENGLIVAGRAVQQGEKTGSVDWSDLLPPPPSALAVLVMHGSVLRAGESRMWRNIVVPLSRDLLAASGYDYTALGHYHTYEHWDHSDTGLTYAAYAGIPQPIHWDDTGPRGYLLGELEEGGARLDYIPAAKHQMQQHTVELPSDLQPNAEERLDERLKAVVSQMSNADMLKLTVHGRWCRNQRELLAEKIGRIQDSAWYAREIDWTKVDFYPEMNTSAGTETYELLNGYLSSALEKANQNEEREEQQALKLAQYLGLRLLAGEGLPSEVQ